MTQLKKYTIIGIIFVTITGTLSHFVYEWTGNNSIIGYFFPVNESTWEHMKLIFFPMLAFSIFMNRKQKQAFHCVTSSLASGILIGTFLIPVFFYTYTGVLGCNIFILDIVTFILSVRIAFICTYKLTLSCYVQKQAFVLYIFVFIVMLCFFVFTYNPPALALFSSPV